MGGCGHDEPAGSVAPGPRPAVSQADQAPPGDAPATHDTSPSDVGTAALQPPLVAIFRLIEQHQTDPARAALGAYQYEHPDDGQAEFLVGLSFHRRPRPMRPCATTAPSSSASVPIAGFRSDPRSILKHGRD